MVHKNRTALLWAGFLTLIAAGMGFGIRGGILGIWGEDYGFTLTELGVITGFGLIGFGIVILVVGFFIDLVGYKPLMMIAFVLHVISAVMTIFADAVFAAGGHDAVYYLFIVSMGMFAVANGICEAVINPLTATLFPEQKTHYLNILHAGWPGGLVLGGLVALLAPYGIAWEVLWSTFLIPVAVYGIIVLMQSFPKTEASASKMSYTAMLLDCLTPFLIVLLITHAMVGYVELGTDSWIQNITGAILSSAVLGTVLFIYQSLLMFALRFFAGPIVHRISNLGLLLMSAIIGSIGLLLICFAPIIAPAGTASIVVMWMAVTVYAIGKTFLWPTMLGIVGDQFPRSATVAMALMGGVGMLSAGYIGAPAIGYNQDAFASSKLEEISEPTYDRYKADKPNSVLMLPPVAGLNGAKVKVALDTPPAAKLERDIAILEKNGEKITDEKNEGINALNTWWQGVKDDVEIDIKPLQESNLYGARMAMLVTAAVPAMMAVMYLLMIVGFQMRGGYKAAEHGPGPSKGKDEEPEATPK